MKQAFQSKVILALGLLLAVSLQNANLGFSQERTQNSNRSIPQDMAFVPFGMSIMGIDKDPSKISKVAHEPSSLYKKRMSMPWSKESFHDEGPAHWVLLDSYLIDKYEVSNEQFGRFMKATGHAAPAYWDDPRLNKPNQPVVGVNWFDAKAFCEWQGKRLPSEAEWENAARGPEGYRYPWGNTFEAHRANYGNRESATALVDSHPEGISSYGLHHMSGNVFEWVADWYDPNYYQKTPHPPNAQGPEKPVWLGGTGTYVDRLTVGQKRVIRGGSWIAAKNSITATHRFWNHPLNNSYGVGLGFRCAMTAPKAVQEKIQTAAVDAMKSMGQERFQEAAAYVDQALSFDPTNPELQRLRELINQSM